MLRDLVDRCKAAVAFVQSIANDGVSGGDQQGKRSGRAAAHPSVRQDAMSRRMPRRGEGHSDFQGEAPGALLMAYREAAEADQGDELRRRSFVI